MKLPDGSKTAGKGLRPKYHGLGEPNKSRLPENKAERAVDGALEAEFPEVAIEEDT